MSYICVRYLRICSALFLFLFFNHIMRLYYVVPGSAEESHATSEAMLLFWFSLGMWREPGPLTHGRPAIFYYCGMREKKGGGQGWLWWKRFILFSFSSSRPQVKQYTRKHTHTHTDLITNRLARQTLKIAQSVFHDNMDHCVPTSGDVVGRTHSLPQLT